MHKARRIHTRLRRNRAEIAKKFVRQDELPFDYSADIENAVPLDAVEFIPADPIDPLPTAGIRVPTTKEARTARGNTIYKDRVLHHESELEHRFSKCAQARADIETVISQPYKARFIDENGKLAHHIFDFHLGFKDGLKVAAAVKPSEKAAELAALLERVVRTGQIVRSDDSLGELSEAFDKITIVTEEWASLEAYHNAGSILWALKKPREQECSIVRERSQSLKSARLRYVDLIAGLPDDGLRRITFWRLVHEGILVPEKRERIDDLTWMVVNGDPSAR